MLVVNVQHWAGIAHIYIFPQRLPYTLALHVIT